MDVQGCLCSPVLGDYLVKVIWDHSVPLIIPESIQHLHLLCRIHRSTSKTKAASAGKHYRCLRAKMLEVGFFVESTHLWSSGHAACILANYCLCVCSHSLNWRALRFTKICRHTLSVCCGCVVCYSALLAEDMWGTVSTHTFRLIWLCQECSYTYTY